MRKREIVSEAFKRIAAMTNREFWQGAVYLDIPPETAAAVRKRALRYYPDRASERQK